MDDKTDKLGAFIYPSELPRVLGTNFISLSQVKHSSGITQEQAEKAVEFLVGRGLFLPWHAAQCPSCTYAWPVCAVGREDDFDQEIICPICNHKTSVNTMPFYEVYEVVK